MSRSSSHITGDAAAARDLVSWAKKNGHDLAEVTVGACKIVLRGKAPTPSTERQLPRETLSAQQQAYAQFGGELYARMTGTAPDTGVRDDYQPALGADS